MKIVLIALLLSSNLLAAEGPSLTLVGDSGQERAMAIADLQALRPREVTATDPHSKEAARYRARRQVGPVRLVVPTDKRGARWVRQVTRIRIVRP